MSYPFGQWIFYVLWSFTAFWRKVSAAMENKFIPQAIEIVTQAINEDNNKNYQEAFRLYKKALEHFMVGVKCTFA